MRLTEPPVTLLRGASLFLDFDGTLVDLAPRPDAIEVSEELRTLLSRLKDKMEGRVALLSGRAMVDVSRFLTPLDLVIGGSHGLEMPGPDGSYPAIERPAGLDEAIDELRGLEARCPGVHVEEKPAGAAIHFRLAPRAEANCLEAAGRAAEKLGMKLQHGKMLVELKPAGADKGTALRGFMSAPPFAGTRPVFFGDDLTDEHGFAAVRELGGAGVLVGPPRQTEALYGLRGVLAVRSWLVAAMEELS